MSENAVEPAVLAPSWFARLHPIVPWLIAWVVLLPLPLLLNNAYTQFVVNVMAINIILAAGLNIVKGFAGQVTVGHIALMAIGAYASGVVSTMLGFPFWIALPTAMAITALAGAIVGIPSLRLEGAYLALATLGLAESVRIYISGTEFLGAAVGFENIPPPYLGGWSLGGHRAYYYVVMPAALLGLYFSFSILSSDIGRAFKSIREDALAAAASGVNVAKYKVIAFVISALYAGAAGSLQAHMAPGFLHPNNYTINEMITLLLMVVFGGIGHVWGGVIGAIVVTIIDDFTRDYYQYRMLMFGAVIVLVVMFMPRGIGGIIDDFLVRRRFKAIRAGRRAHPMLLEVKNLTKRFGGFTAVSNVNLSVAPGEVRGIIGPNGSGKSTLFNLISGVYTPEPGAVVRFDGQDITNKESHEIARLGVARTFQMLRIFQGMSVIENMLVGHHAMIRYGTAAAVIGSRKVWREERRVRAEMMELLAFIGLADYAEMPAGELSGGQRRLLALGRAMAAKPKLLMLDEPGAGLSPANVDILLDTVRALRARFGLTVVIIEHILKLVMETCEIVSVLEHGEKIAEGTPGEIKSNHRVIEAYLGKEMRDEEVRAYLRSA